MKKLERKIEKVVRVKNPIFKKKRVAAYARVSMDADNLKKSFAAQISYYNQLIQSNSEWEFAGVYSDYAVSGTGTIKRNGFNDMILEAKNGKIDIILTKSISRFARNTVDLLNVVRELKEIGVEIRFEKENISTLSSSGELMLSILASFAQSEAENISSNVRWAIKKKFESGKPMASIIYGYDYNKGTYTINKNEAKVVKEIFNRFLDGETYTEIARELNSRNIKTKKGNNFSFNAIKDIISLEKYAGFSILQKKYVVSPITHKAKRNKGELPQYKALGTHPAIISEDTYNKAIERVKFITKNRVKLHKQSKWYTGLVKCPVCGKSMIKSNSKSLKCIGNTKHHTCDNMETLLISDLEKFVKDKDLNKIDYIIFNRVRHKRFSRVGHRPGDNNIDRNIKKGDFKIVWKEQ